ncbi:MAG TPA: DMT family transporter [Deltaproteobacteria bacterium]|nr:DMT family transporter [Deltaproteobacteria bacterium]
MRMMLSGLTWACLAPVFYAAMSSASKLAAAHLNIWQVGLGRFILGLVVAPIIVRILGLDLWGRKRFLLTLRGLCGSVAFLLLVASFQKIPLSLAMVLFYLYPAFTALLSPWVAGEAVPRSAWPFVIGAFIGTTVILWPVDSDGSSIGLGHILAIIASILCALTLLLVRRLGKDNNIYTLFYYLCLTGCLACLGPLLIQKGPILPVESIAWMKLAAVAVFSIGAQLTINQALVQIPASKVSVIMTAEVPLVACFGIVFLGEPLDWRLLAGALFIFGSGVGLNLIPALSDRGNKNK